MRNKFLPVLVMVIFTHSIAFGFCFNQAGETYQISPELLSAIARVESGLDPSAVSQNRNGSYDLGLMQINSSWKKRLCGRWRHLTDPCYNVMVGAWILRQCVDRYGNTWDSVACYHTGKGLADSSHQKQKLARKYIRKVQTAMTNRQ
ncbi:MAG: murein transglycosylase [Desulfobacterales bacterium CG23_combo_of_CG06-09_8_20_14_all_51_8]|nr:MAG: murein transglycosylase [Desulfobacterales bacterium CG23_combo_of_CG06-09_8_20_14_all_51_8]